MEITFRRLLLILLVFVLPWQARYFFLEAKLNAVFWEYGSVYVLAWEIILWANIMFNFRQIKNFFNSRYSFFVFLGLFLPLLSVFKAKLPWLALFSWSHILEAFVIYALLAGLNEEEKSILRQFFIISAIVQVFIGAAQFFAQYSPASAFFGVSEHDPRELGVSVVEVGVERWLRAYGTLPHPNILGGFIAVAMLFTQRLYAFRWTANTGGRGNYFSAVYAMAAWTMLCIGLVLTFSKNAWLAIAVSSLIALFKLKGSARIASAKLLFIFLAVFSLSAFVQPNLVLGRLAGDGRLNTQSIEERKLSLRNGLELIRENLFFGYGLGNYTYELMLKNPKWLGYYYQPIHNAFLAIWSEAGIYMLIFVLIFMILRMKRLRSLSWLFFVLALFDHYLASLPFGLYLTALSYGLWAEQENLDGWAIMPKVAEKKAV